MILNIDIKGLEVVCVAFLSKDKKLYEELNADVDIHTMNQEALGLPNRLVAKIYKFRTIYGGTVFHTDPDFMGVSTNRKFWDKVRDKYYEKYSGISSWHKEIIKQVTNTGKLTTPTGRTFEFEWLTNYKGERELPATQIKNYPCQSLGADVMAVIRVDFFRRFKKSDIKGLLICTVHDSLVLDLESMEECLKAKQIFLDVLKDFPYNFERIFGVPFDLEVRCEMEVGQNQYNLAGLL